MKRSLIQELSVGSPMSFRMSRVNTLFLSVVVALTTFGPATAVWAETNDQTSADEWVVHGGGWGHGVGMAQYGAQAMALAGSTTADILDHYYSGAELADLADREIPDWWSTSYPVVIGIAQHLESVPLQAIVGDVSICQTPVTGGTCGSLTIPSGQTWTVAAADGACVVTDHDGVSVSEGSCGIEISWVDNSATSKLAVNRVKATTYEYAHGSIRILPALDGDGVDVILDVPMELYLRGLAEMPSDWHPEALAAQVVAARNYTVRKVLDNSDSSGVPVRDCQCHLYRDTRDQEYRAWSKEGISPNGWVDAVEATPGRVAIHPPSGTGVFTAYYSSSTGGQTQSNERVWDGEPLPWLRSVDDPWSVSESVANPNANWEQTVNAADLANAMQWDSVIGVELVADGADSTALVFGIDGEDEVTAELSGDALRSKFGLKSSFITSIEGSGSPGTLGDIAESVHAEDILFIADRGITKGCNPPQNTLFCPSDVVTRGQMAAFLVRALGLSEEAENGFRDDDGSVFEVDIARLANAGITMGCNPPDNDQFCPERAVTRGEMAAFLSRAFAFAEGLEPAAQSIFVDGQTSVFAVDITALARVGVTLGCNPPTNDRFCPDDVVTREQMASFLTRSIRLAEAGES